MRIAIEQDVPIQFDEVAQSPFFTYSQAGENAPQEGGGEGAVVSRGDAVSVEHEVWFEDVRSLQGKFDLIREFDLGAAAIGRLCGGSPPTGDYCTRIFIPKNRGRERGDTGTSLWYTEGVKSAGDGRGETGARKGGGSMRMYDIIMKKRNGGKLSSEEIRFFIQGYTQGRSRITRSRL